MFCVIDTSTIASGSVRWQQRRRMVEEAVAAHSGATDDELRAQFAALDADGDGQLSVAEVQVCTREPYSRVATLTGPWLVRD